MAEAARARGLLAGLIIAGVTCLTGGAFASVPGDSLSHPDDLAARAQDIRVERRTWDATTGIARTQASAKASREWLQRLVATGLRDARRTPGSPCVVACRHCPDQLSVDVRFKADS